MGTRIDWSELERRVRSAPSAQNIPTGQQPSYRIVPAYILVPATHKPRDTRAWYESPFGALLIVTILLAAGTCLGLLLSAWVI